MCCCLPLKVVKICHFIACLLFFAPGGMMIWLGQKAKTETIFVTIQDQMNINIIDTIYLVFIITGCFFMFLALCGVLVLLKYNCCYCSTFGILVFLVMIIFDVILAAFVYGNMQFSTLSDFCGGSAGAGVKGILDKIDYVLGNSTRILCTKVC